MENRELLHVSWADPAQSAGRCSGRRRLPRLRRRSIEALYERTINTQAAGLFSCTDSPVHATQKAGNQRRESAHRPMINLLLPSIPLKDITPNPDCICCTPRLGRGARGTCCTAGGSTSPYPASPGRAWAGRYPSCRRSSAAPWGPRPLPAPHHRPLPPPLLQPYLRPRPHPCPPPSSSSLCP